MSFRACTCSQLGAIYVCTCPCICACVHSFLGSDTRLHELCTHTHGHTHTHSSSTHTLGSKVCVGGLDRVLRSVRPHARHARVLGKEVVLTRSAAQSAAQQAAALALRQARMMWCIPLPSLTVLPHPLQTKRPTTLVTLLVCLKLSDRVKECCYTTGPATPAQYHNTIQCHTSVQHHTPHTATHCNATP